MIGWAEDDPIYRHYLALLDGGTKPNLAKLTIARQIASIALAVWRTREVYDPKRLEEALTRAEVAEGRKSLRGVGPRISTVQGRASIEILGRASGPESHEIGYAPWRAERSNGPRSPR